MSVMLVYFALTSLLFFSLVYRAIFHSFDSATILLSALPCFYLQKLENNDQKNKTRRLMLYFVI